MESKNIDSIEGVEEPQLTKQQKKNRKKREAAKRKKQNLSSNNCNTWQFPLEIWEVILHHVHGVKELKNLSLVCRLFNNMLKDKLWNAPKFKSGITPEDFLKLKHLPIKKLYTGDFGKLADERRGELTGRWIEVISKFTQLTSLKLGWNIDLTYSYIGKLTVLTNLKSLTFERLYAGISKAISQLIHLPLESFCIEDLIYYSDVEPISEIIGQMSTMKKLEIQTNENGCIYLSKLPQLEELIINESDLTTTGVRYFCKLKSLKKVKFYQCWYSGDTTCHESTDLLKAANPNLQIEVDCIDIDNYEDDSDYVCDYDDEDLPPEFLDNYNELYLVH